MSESSGLGPFLARLSPLYFECVEAHRSGDLRSFFKKISQLDRDELEALVIWLAYVDYGRRGS